MSQCDVTKKAKKDLEVDSQYEDHKAESEINNILNEDVTNEKADEIKEEFKDTEVDNPISESELDSKLFKIFNGKKKAVWVAKLKGALAGNPVRRAVMLQDIHTEALKFAKKGLLKMDPKTGKVDLMSLPIGTIKKMYWKTTDWTNAKGFEGFFGRNFVVPYIRPKYLKYKEPTGGYAVLEMTVARYLQRVATHQNRFWNGWPEKQIPTKYDSSGINPISWTSMDRGMHDVIQSVSNIANSYKPGEGKEVNIDAANRYFTDLFHMLGTGWIKEENGKLYIHNKWAPQMEGKDAVNPKQKRYDTGEAVFDWAEPILLERFDESKHSNLDLRVQRMLQRYMPLNNQQLGSMLQLRDEALFIHDQVFKYLNGRRDDLGNVTTKGLFQSTKDDLTAELMNWFKDPVSGAQYTKEQVAAVIFDNNPNNIPIPDHLVDTVKELREFTQFNIFETMFLDTKEMGYKQRLPIQYTPYEVPFMLDEALQKEKKALDELDRMIKNPDVTSKQKWELLRKRKRVILAIKKTEASIESSNGQPHDPVNDHTMMARKDSVHAKHISNAMDPMSMRLDKDVYKGYLANNFHTIERNRMTIALLQGLRLAKDNQATKDAMISLYKGTMGDPDTRTLFPLLGDVSPANISRRIGKFGIKVSTDKINRTFSVINKYMAGHFLASPLTAIMNSGQNIQKLIDLGSEAAGAAKEYYDTYKEDPGFVRLIENSGVVQFADYFSDSLIGEMESREEGYDKADKVMKAMFKYHKEAKKIGEEKAYDNFYKVARDVFGREKGGQYENPPMLELDDLKKRRKAFRSRRMNEIMNKFANYAINKQYKPKYGKKIYSKPFNGMKATAKAWTKIYTTAVGSNLTMAHTESRTRSMSFIAGVQAFLKLTNIEAQPHELINRIKTAKTSEERQRFTKEYQAALEAGRVFADDLDFSLESHNYAEMHRTPIGRLLMRFATWGQQKFGKDWRTTHDAHYSLMDSNTFFGRNKAKFKARTKAIFTGGKKLRATNNDIAALRAFYKQGIATFLFDFMFISPVFFNRIPFVRKIPGARRVGGFTSDYASLLQAPLMMTLKYAIAAGKDDPEEEQEAMHSNFVNIFRRSQVGLGSNMIIDAIIGMGALFSDHELDEKYKRASKPLNYIIKKDLLDETYEAGKQLGAWGDQGGRFRKRKF